MLKVVHMQKSFKNQYFSGGFFKTLATTIYIKETSNQYLPTKLTSFSAIYILRAYMYTTILYYQVIFTVSLLVMSHFHKYQKNCARTCLFLEGESYYVYYVCRLYLLTFIINAILRRTCMPLFQFKNFAQDMYLPKYFE